MTYSPTFVTHLLAMKMKKTRQIGAWLADYGDPFSVNPGTVNNTAMYSGLNRISERAVLRCADASSFTNATTEQLYQQHFPDGEKIVIPHAVSLQEFAELPKAPTRDIPELAYVGALHRSIREPGPTIANLLKVLSIRPGLFTMRFIGTMSGVSIDPHPAI